MNYFNVLEELNIVNKHSGTINGAMDEWYDGMQLNDKLRQALMWEEDENFEELRVDKYSNEFIFCLFKYLCLGGGLCQYDDRISEYLETTKTVYKDFICVAKDAET
jgi:hypothetical protein